MTSIWTKSRQSTETYTPKQHKRATIIGWSLIGYFAVSAIVIGKGLTNVVKNRQQ